MQGKELYLANYINVNLKYSNLWWNILNCEAGHNVFCNIGVAYVKHPVFVQYLFICSFIR
jgi:hypothetical protein